MLRYMLVLMLSVSVIVVGCGGGGGGDGSGDLATGVPSVEKATIQGTVAGSGTVLADVKVTVKTDAGVVVAETTTDSSGEYSVEVTPGTYRVEFSDPEQDAVTVEATEESVTVNSTSDVEATFGSSFFGESRFK